jgi:hypothetical protein
MILYKIKLLFKLSLLAREMPYVKDLIKHLRRDPCLRQVCGYHNKTPSEAHFTQMKKRVGAESVHIIETWLRKEALRLGAQPLSAAGLVQVAGIDDTDLLAWSSRNPYDTGQGLGDPNAKVGRGKKGFSLGYLSLFLDIEGFPLGHVGG